MKYDRHNDYPTLNDKLGDQYVIDIMLHSGEVVYMCIQGSCFDFRSIEKDKYIDAKNIKKIKLTERLVLRHKKHNWIWSMNWCGRCHQRYTKPLPALCGVIYKVDYPKAYPDYNPRSRIIPKFGKKEFPFNPLI